MSPMKLIVNAGSHPRRSCPVVTEVPLQAPREVGACTLITERGGELPAQLLPPHPLCGRPSRDDLARIAFIIPEMTAGEQLSLEMKWTDDAPAARVQVDDDGRGKASISVGGDLFTIYRYLGNPARPCFYPLLDHSGRPVTRSWPIEDNVPGEPHDHPHHRSLWVAHGDVNGADNWSEGEGHAYQLHRAVLAAHGGPVLGRLAALNHWTDRDQRKLLEERRCLTVWAVEGARIFDLDVCFTATECDVRFGDTKEGGIIAMRVNPMMDGDHGGRIENSYGAVGETECWGKRAQWCDYSGVVDGETVGVAIFNHPRSFRHPTFWHVRAYGMYTANPFGWHDFCGDPAADGSHLLPQGASLWFHYRVYLHRGSAAEAPVAARYHDYANPPRVEAIPA